MTAFLEKDVADIHSYNDDPMVIAIKCEVWKIKRAIVNKGSYADILYCEAF